MNKIKKICLFIFSIVSIALSQDLQIQWSKTYDYKYANNIDFAHDGGYVFTTYDDKTIVKIDKHGIVQEDWPLNSGENPIISYLQKCNEGYIILSTTPMLIKLDNQGRQEWEKQYYENKYGEVDYWYTGEFVKQTHDNGYILFCTKNNNADPSGSRKSFMFIKTDLNGEKEWQSGASGDYYGKNTSKAVHQLSDGGYIFAYNNDDGGLTRLSPDGKDIWEKRYDEYLEYTLPADDGGFFICGRDYTKDTYSSETAYLKKVDQNGDEIWKKTFQNASSYSLLNNIELLNDGNILVCGKIVDTSDWSSSECWLIKTDSLGNKIWEKTFSELDDIKQILKIDNNEFLLFGIKDYYTTIMKIKENDPKDPSSFALLDPVFHKLGVGTQLCLDWSSIANASSYLVEIDDSIDMSNPLISKTVSNSSGCIIKDLTYSTQYYWRVRAQFPDGSGKWSGISTFTTMIPPHIELDGKKNNMSYVDVRDQYYTDRDYTVTGLSDELKNCLWIKTQNSDKYLTDDNYIQFNLKRDATVYVAYDNRASSVPHWLSSGFELTEHTIQNSDEESNFNIWKGRFPAGDVTLGANSASGAEGAQTNYVVLIDVPLQILDPRDNKSGIGNDLILSWETLGNFGSYDLQISEYQDMSIPLYNITNIMNPKYRIEELDYNKDYFWRIKAHNRNDENAWYQTQKFHTMREPHIKILWQDEYLLSWLEENEQYYIDCNHVVLSIPDQLKNLLWIKTANDDADIIYSFPLEFRLQSDATIYVGFDSRATALPNWVTEHYSNTGLSITVSDSANELNIWARNVIKGDIELGFNMAEGAENIKSHYVVLIDTNQVPPLSAHFGSDVTSGVLPLTVNFADSSKGFITSWLWDFGDGTTSTEKNPSHTFKNSGNYNVSLTVIGMGSSDTITKENNITVKNMIVNFSADVTMGKAPLTVSFTDSSLGEIDAWLWKFGDGLTSTSQNPTHVYTSGDSFTVSLFVRGPGGSNTMVKTNFIIVDHPTSIDDMAGIPDKFDLLPNYPNPFNPQTTIRFAVPKKSFVTLTVYDINGKQVSNLFSGIKNPGYFSLTWNASGFPSGMYFIKMDTDTYSSVQKCILVK